MSNSSSSDDENTCESLSENVSLDENSDSDDEIRMLTNRKMRICSESGESSADESTVLDDLDTDTFVQLPSDINFSNETNNTFFEIPGPKHLPADIEKPIGYFELFFTSLLIKTIVQETNRYAQQFIYSGKEIKPKSRVKLWKPVTQLEIKAFIAVLLEMGITRRPNMYSYWSNNSRSIPWFKKMFSRDRFQLILKFFHMVDNKEIAPPGHPDYDPSARFSPLVDHANKVFRHYYQPHRELSIDESLVGTKCNSIMKQYLPNKKHHRWGIKFWMLCDSITNYCLGFFCYKSGKVTDDQNEINEHGLGYSVVHKLLSIGDYLNKGYHLFTDNFYTSVKLAKALLVKCTYITGTIRRNRKNLPNEAKTADVGVPKYFKNEDVLLCSFRDKKSKKFPVLLISTHANTSNVTTKRKKGTFEVEKTKPSIIHNYNKFMGGVDESDKMLYVYLDERKTLKFWKKITFRPFGRRV